MTVEEIPFNSSRIRPIKVRNAEDVVLDLNRPYLIKGWMYQRQISFWYGPSTCGKTFLMQHIAWALARDRAVFGRRVDRRGSVLYLSMEPGQIDERIIALRAVAGETDRFNFTEDALNLFDGPAAAAQIVAMAREHSSTLIVIDPISAAMAGANENDYADVSIVVDRMRWISVNADAHVAAVAHTGKDTDKGQRGSSHWFASGDLVASVKEDLGNERVVEIVKARDAGKGDTYRFKLNPFLLGVDDDGDECRTLTVEELGKTVDTARPPLTEMQRLRFEFIRDLFADEYLTHTAIQPAEGMSREVCVRRADVLAAMEKKGWIQRTDGKALADKERQKFKSILETLEAKKRLCANDQWVWLT